MLRKFMTKQVTKTTVKIAKMRLENGTPKAIPLDDLVLLGNISKSKAQRIVDKEYEGATVLETTTETLVYEMEVEEFIKLAKIKED